MRKTVLQALILTTLMTSLGVLYAVPGLAETSGTGTPVATKTCTPNPVKVFEPITCIITVTNEGTAPVENFDLTDWFRAHDPSTTVGFVEVVSVKVNGRDTLPLCELGWEGEVMTRTVTCRHLGPLNPGETITMEVVLIPQQSGTFTNSGGVSTIHAVPGSVYDTTRLQDTVELVVSEPAPTTEQRCKNGGYVTFGFKNQGQCLKAVRQAS